MNNQELATKAEAFIAEDKSLNAKLIERPRAMPIPFKKSQEDFYLLLSLVFADSPVIASEARSSCILALQLVVQSGIASNFSGIEIVPYTKSNTQMRRLFRLSVLKESLGLALHLRESDLLNDRPKEGITCGWYTKKPES